MTNEPPRVDPLANFSLFTDSSDDYDDIDRPPIIRYKNVRRRENFSSCESE